MRVIAEGGPEAEYALGEILKLLDEVDDALLQEDLGVALMGSQWQDVGGEVIRTINLKEKYSYDSGLASNVADDLIDEQYSPREYEKRQNKLHSQSFWGGMSDWYDNIFSEQRVSQFDSFGMNDGLSEKFEKIGDESGKAVGAGMTQGIEESSETVEKAGNEMADGLVNSLNEKLEIDSYSAVLKSLGEASAEGYREGIMDQFEQLEEEVDSAFDKIFPNNTRNGAKIYSTITIKHVVGGKIAVEGTNTQGELIGVSDIIVDQLKLHGRL